MVKKRSIMKYQLLCVCKCVRGKTVIAVCFLLLLRCLQYSQLGQLSVGPLSYSEDENGNLLPFVICKNLYRKRNLDPSKQVFEIDTELEKGENSASSLAR